VYRTYSDILGSTITISSDSWSYTNWLQLCFAFSRENIQLLYKFWIYLLWKLLKYELFLTVEKKHKKNEIYGSNNKIQLSPAKKAGWISWQNLTQKKSGIIYIHLICHIVVRIINTWRSVHTKMELVHFFIFSKKVELFIKFIKKVVPEFVIRTHQKKTTPCPVWEYLFFIHWEPLIYKNCVLSSSSTSGTGSTRKCINK
jgi:hypothetical protein